MDQSIHVPSDSSTKFILELEFVQCLANPAYIHYLAQRGYFKDGGFISFLKYLQYWKSPPYLFYIQYPNCFVYLDMIISSEAFRLDAARNESIIKWHEQQYLVWKQGRKYQQEQYQHRHLFS